MEGKCVCVGGEGCNPHPLHFVMQYKIILGPTVSPYRCNLDPPKSWSLSTYAHLKGQTICTSMHTMYVTRFGKMCLTAQIIFF